MQFMRHILPTILLAAALLMAWQAYCTLAAVSPLLLPAPDLQICQARPMQALVAGRADFTLEVATWKGVNGVLLGRQKSYFTYADYGIPDQQNGYIGTRAEVLQEDAEMVAAFMQATQQGYEWAADHPAQAADMLMAAGEFPNPALVGASIQSIVGGGYLRDGDTAVGTIDADRFAAMARFLFDSGVLKDTTGTPLEWPGDVSAWFDQSWLAD
ncbi:ABC transporter substrate-binding protein [Pseudorhodobacter turbinis]|uniref:ABC transporter substrate-binding protein n=1 Tax=Pseudorhodobacter turbinis TaxID=2500533 RepID=UPI001F119349|nr:ABC transporter substrate-binding protein [Pseudorhodobacter turbinis]